MNSEPENGVESKNSDDGDCSLTIRFERIAEWVSRPTEALDRQDIWGGRSSVSGRGALAPIIVAARAKACGLIAASAHLQLTRTRAQTPECRGRQQCV